MGHYSTLTSLAMLKINIDQGNDYLSYLYPFVNQIIYDLRNTIINTDVIHTEILNRFGLDIPARTIQIILKRLSRKGIIYKDRGVYYSTDKITDPQIYIHKIDADQRIKSVINGLRTFSNNYLNKHLLEDDAVNLICSFLEKFSVHCLKAYLSGTTIPEIKSAKNSDIVLVSKYILFIQDNNSQEFESFLVLLTGNMLANALLCPDLNNLQQTYKNTNFYLDTPLVLRLLGLEGKYKQDSAYELLSLIQNLGGKIYIFSHSRNEIENVIRASADFIDSPNGRGSIVMEARKENRTKSDLILIAEQLDIKLSEAQIFFEQTPGYSINFSIDEMEFDRILSNELHYYSDKAKLNDINSVRCIYEIRSGHSPHSIENAKAILITSNSKFAKAAFEYGIKYEESKEVSSVITDFSLANISWLKSPMGAPRIPQIELISFAYAAVQPSKILLNKFLLEIEKLEKNGSITERDHQLLRSSKTAINELMNLTLGDEEALTFESIQETLNRITNEIIQDENKKFIHETNEHNKTKEELRKEKEKTDKLKKHIYWKCNKKAERLSSLIIITICIILFIIPYIITKPINITNLYDIFYFIPFALVFIFETLNLFFGISILSIKRHIQQKLLNYFLKRESIILTC